MASFVALDFETANGRRGSACALGLVKVIRNRIVEKEYYLMDPQDEFSWYNIRVHGIRPKDVNDAPYFPDVWRKAKRHINDVPFVAAHNASFDRSVLDSCCNDYGIRMPKLAFVCSIEAAKQFCELDSYSLPNVARHLDIELDHHHALSDAIACAKIIIQASQLGIKVENLSRN